MFDTFGDWLSDDSVDLDDRRAEARENLHALVSPEPYGIEDMDVTQVAVVNEGPEGEPIVVPVARFSLGAETDSPDFDVVWDLAFDAVRAMYPAFEGVYVRHYDVQFAFGGRGLFDAASCRRMAVSRDIADRLVTETGYRIPEFERAMLDGHDVDDGVAPVAWGQCEEYDRDGYGGAGAATSAGMGG